MTFPNVFHQQRPTPKNNTPPILLPTFCFTHEKKWPGKRRIFQSTFTKPKGIVQPMVGVFFSIKNTLFLVEIHHLPGGCGRIMRDVFFGRYILRWSVGGYLLKRIWFNEEKTRGAPVNMNGMGRIPIIWNKKNMYTTMRYPDSDWQWQ